MSSGAYLNTLAAGAARKWLGKRRDIEFFREVTHRNAEGCWIWPGHTDSKGYGTGRFSHPEGKSEKAHRVAWEVSNGAPVPDEMTVDHRCFNTSCVNPDHLQLLSRSENAARSRRSLSSHCPNGHAYTVENTVTRKGSRAKSFRSCRTCEQARMARVQAKGKR